MHAFRKLAFAAALAAVGACGSDRLAAPDLDTSIDPTIVEQRTADVESVYDQPAMASLFAMSEFGAVGSVNRLLQRTTTQLRTHRTIVSGTGLRPDRPALAVAAFEPAIPLDARGGVFVYDDLEGYWVLDDSRTGPADGVRFMLRALDGEGGFSDEEIGSVEVRDLTTSSQFRLLTTVLAGTLTVMSFEERASGSEESGSSYSFAGFITDGAHRVDLSDVYSQKPVGEVMRAVEDFTWSLRSGASFRARWIWAGTTATDQDWSEVRFDGNTFRWVTPYVWYAGSQMYDAGPVTNLYGNGHHLAVITADQLSGLMTYETPAGEPLEATQVEGLVNLDEVLGAIAELIYLPYHIVDAFVSDIGGGVQ